MHIKLTRHAPQLVVQHSEFDTGGSNIGFMAELGSTATSSQKQSSDTAGNKAGYTRAYLVAMKQT
eukprot:m.1683197 g.1683197  ORF g.1683197 m.1683197 type:complete len:65 (-) comp236408_c0_seq1:9-203(-)